MMLMLSLQQPVSAGVLKDMEFQERKIFLENTGETLMAGDISGTIMPIAPFAEFQSKKDLISPARGQ